MVVPSPEEALLQPSASCTPVRSLFPKVCAFGPPKETASSGVALMGDSHSTHWRAALAVVARRRNWFGLSINRNDCPFTYATRTPGKGACRGWARSVVAWLRAHRGVRRVVVSAKSGSGVISARGKTRTETKIAGYIRAWKALPASVIHIFVIRDVPVMRSTTNACVSGAIARDHNPALRCALPRASALATDLAAVAAEQADDPRVHLVDLSEYMCDDVNCYPVVGGALVMRDNDHLTRTFSTSMGPFLGRELERLETPDGFRSLADPRRVVGAGPSPPPKAALPRRRPLSPR
jgi:hypothetical protein